MQPAADPAHDTDESLMLRFAAGDMEAFEQLYSRHELPVWRFVLRSVRSPELADDLLQDVWFSVVRQAGRYAATARFKTWLFTMARHRVIDHIRTQKHHLSLDDNDASASGEGGGTLQDSLAADSGFGPLRQLQTREQAAALIGAVEQLPPEQREAFLLQAEGGMSVDEVARATGASFETTKSRLRYARSSLRKLLQEFE